MITSCEHIARMDKARFCDRAGRCADDAELESKADALSAILGRRAGGEVDCVHWLWIIHDRPDTEVDCVHWLWLKDALTSNSK